MFLGLIADLGSIYGIYAAILEFGGNLWAETIT